MMPGIRFFPSQLDRVSQERLRDAVRLAIEEAPLFVPVMPRSGRPFSVRMTNLGPLGWVSDRQGYRYQATHPETGRPWPPIHPDLLELWRSLSDHPHPPEACLVNVYRPGARMGLHRDADEVDFSAPVLSVSLGDTAVFRMGGPVRTDSTASIELASGDVLVMGGRSRLCYHGVDRIKTGTSTLLGEPGRINLTLRRVGRPDG